MWSHCDGVTGVNRIVLRFFLDLSPFVRPVDTPNTFLPVRPTAEPHFLCRTVSHSLSSSVWSSLVPDVNNLLVTLFITSDKSDKS